jgi:hypothetical protein
LAQRFVFSGELIVNLGKVVLGSGDIRLKKAVPALHSVFAGFVDAVVPGKLCVSYSSR